MEKFKKKEDEHIGVSYNYYLSVVPTTYVDVSGNEYFVHQFTSNENEIETHHLPAVYFRYPFPFTAAVDMTSPPSRSSLLSTAITSCTSWCKSAPSSAGSLPSPSL